LELIPHFSNRPPQPHLFYPGDQSGRLDAQVPQLGGTEQITQTFPNRRPFVDYADNRAILIHGLAPGTPPNLSGKQAERFVSRIIQSRIDRIEQFFFVERFVQKRHRSSFKGLGSPIVILVRGDKDERYLRAGQNHVTLELESAHAMHPHIEDQAACLLHLIGPQERFRRGKTLHP
jgi:hypothetical protein